MLGPNFLRKCFIDHVSAKLSKCFENLNVCSSSHIKLLYAGYVKRFIQYMHTCTYSVHEYMYINTYIYSSNIYIYHIALTASGREFKFQPGPKFGLRFLFRLLANSTMTIEHTECTLPVRRLNGEGDDWGQRGLIC